MLERVTLLLSSQVSRLGYLALRRGQALIPGYFSFAMRNDRKAILDFFKGVMDRSPLPVMIYNFP